MKLQTLESLQASLTGDFGIFLMGEILPVAVSTQDDSLYNRSASFAQYTAQQQGGNLLQPANKL